MINISAYQGLGQFGSPYKVMFENDTHAPGSIDRILMENMVRLCSETADYLYSEYTPTRSFYQKRARVEGTTPSLPLQQYAGTYANDLYGEVKVTEEDGKLVMEFAPAAYTGDLEHWNYDTFQLA